MPEQAAPNTQHPTRSIGFRDLVLLYVVTGVSLRWIATAASIGPSSLVIWIAAWLLFYVPLALSVIELSSRYPAEGGLYVWTKKAFGEGPGFLAAWMYWNSNLPYFPAVLYFAASNALFLHPALAKYSHSSSYFVLFSVVILAGLTILNIVGMNIAKWSFNVGALAMWIPALMVVVMGLVAWARFGSATSFHPAAFVPSMHLRDIIFWSTIVFAFGGCETGSFLAEEVKNPRRNIPRALLLAGTTITLCYLLGTFCVLLALPSSETSNLDGLVQALAKTAGRLGLAGITPTAAALIAISNIGAAAAFLAAAARLPFVAGIDGYLPRAFGKLHPRWGTPYVSVLLQGLIGIAFVFLGQAGTSVRGAYDVLVSIGVITYMVPYLFLFASLIRLQRDPATADVIRVPGGRRVAYAVACVGLTTTSVAILLSLVPPPEETRKFLAASKVIGSAVLLAGVGLAVYWAGRGKIRDSDRSR
ncbi:MAG TPA: APC family permease [Candidatus Saccharimonadales bacterium]|nr:APC family permease [Candidatus Saccharimonadales bacterium]